jgi:branched-chain amino acid transport system ATP-binding protein
MSDPILRTEGLTKTFGGVVATNDVSISVPRGELRCIIGPNGAGKSTLFSLLCGMRRGIGLTFQTNRAFHRLSVRQNLDAVLQIMRADRPTDADDRYRFALDRFGLDPDSEMPAKELPHHRLQWLEIAMVLAAGPDIVLLDEPTAGMSIEETLQTGTVLKHLNSSGLTIVVVEHDVAFVRDVARRITVMHQGRVFAEGTVDEITEHADVRRIYLGQA